MILRCPRRRRLWSCWSQAGTEVAVEAQRPQARWEGSHPGVDVGAGRSR